MELPDNQFSDVVREMRNDGESWHSIYRQIDRTYDVVDHETFEASKEDLPAVKLYLSRCDDKVDEVSYVIQEGETVEDVVDRARNAPAVSEVLRYEEGHTVTVLQ